MSDLGVGVVVIAGIVISMPQRRQQARLIYQYLMALKQQQHVLSECTWLEDTPEPKAMKAWPNARRALLHYQHHPKITHVMIVQDDVGFSPALPFLLKDLVTLMPDHPISLFTQNRPNVLAAIPQGARWLVDCNLLFAQALIWPIALAKAVVEFSDTYVPETARFPNDDPRFCFWASAVGEKFWLTNPSLVQHQHANSSTIGSNSKMGRFDRDAAWFDVEGQSRDWDWSTRLQYPKAYDHKSVQHWRSLITAYTSRGWTRARNNWFNEHDRGYGTIPVFPN